MTKRLLTTLLQAILIFTIFPISGYAAKRVAKKTCSLKTISIIDRNGMSETISNSERIRQYQCVDFSRPQPYQKVLRIYQRNTAGDIRSFINSYHENGLPKQYLEVVNSRAFGAYKEWHPNGQIKLWAFIVGGEADISPAAEVSWLFDGGASVWDEEGYLTAQFTYKKGEQQGDSFYYHPNGNIWKKVPYKNNQIHGSYEVYLENQQLFQRQEYTNGQKHGPSLQYWNPNQLSAQEEYQEGLLIFGRYFDLKGQLVSEVDEGDGRRSIFGKKDISEIHEHRHGVPEGEIVVFGSDHKPLRKFQVKNDQKHGEEIEYYEIPHIRHIPKLSISWYEGKVQGIVKTWYDNGVQESKREMSNNAKNGILTAWYRDGHLMLIEEYDQNKLMKGEYYKKGEKHPLSLIKDGKGIVSVFDPEGNFVKKVPYDHGIPTGKG